MCLCVSVCYFAEEAGAVALGMTEEAPLQLVVVGAGPHALTLMLRLRNELLQDGNADLDLTPADLARRDYW